ncbi:MAG TPA: hypothetical protein VGJ73_12215, partial [Verrucomicrobiae bacterium]
MPLLFRRVVVCFCWAIFLAIPAAGFGQTNYFAAYGTEYPVIGSLPGDQVLPDLSLNTNGGYIVWQDNITDPVGEGISAMRINSTLSGSGATFAVNANSTNAANAHVVMLKNGGAAFTWQARTNGLSHIYARFLNASNLWQSSTDICVSTFTSGSQVNPAIAPLSNGNVIVVWSSYNQVNATSMMDVYGQLLSSNGIALGTNFLINQLFTPYNQRNPAVAALNNGGFVVAWISEQENKVAVTNSADAPQTSLSFPSVDVYDRLYTVSGSNATPSCNESNVDTGIFPCSSPAVATAADGSYMVTWCAKDLTTPNNGWDIYERSFTNSIGGSVKLVNAYTYGDQYNPRISVIGGNYLIVWTSLGQDGSREGV